MSHQPGRRGETRVGSEFGAEPGANVAIYHGYVRPPLAHNAPIAADTWSVRQTPGIPHLWPATGVLGLRCRGEVGQYQFCQELDIAALRPLGSGRVAF